MTDTGRDALRTLFERLDELRSTETGANETGPTSTVLVFRVDEEHGVDIRDIREISKWRAITPVPRVPRTIVGVMSLRGIMVPVIDLRARLGMPAIAARPASSRILVVAREGELCGLIVDAVVDVLRFRPDEIEPPPPMAAAPSASAYSSLDCVLGIGRQGERTVVLLNLNAVLDLAPRENTRAVARVDTRGEQ